MGEFMIGLTVTALVIFVLVQAARALNAHTDGEIDHTSENFWGAGRRHDHHEGWLRAVYNAGYASAERKERIAAERRAESARREAERRGR